MNASSRFQPQMARLTDAQLWEVLQTLDEYVPEAIAAAEAEWDSRNIRPEDHPSLSLDREQHRRHHAGIHWKLLASYNQGINRTTAQIGHLLRPIDQLGGRSLKGIMTFLLILTWGAAVWLGRDLLWQISLPPALKFGGFALLVLGYPISIIGLLLSKKWGWILAHVLLIEVCIHHFASYLLTLRTYAEQLQYVRNLPFPQAAIWENLPALFLAVVGLLFLSHRYFRTQLRISGYEHLRVWLLGLLILGMVYFSPFF